MVDLDVSSFGENDTYFTANSSYIGRFICCIPLLGIIPQMIIEYSIQRDIDYTSDTSKLIELIETKNDYKISSVIRNIISTVLPIFGLFFLIGALLDVIYISQNERIITQLLSTGYKSDLRVK